MRSTSFVSNKPRVGWPALAAGLALLVTSISPVLAQVAITCPPDITVSNDAGLCSAVVDFPAPTVTGTNASDVVACAPASGSTFPVGSNDVVCTVTEASTNLASCSFTITVENTAPPVITNVVVSRSVLWPPNHKMVTVTVDFEESHPCGLTASCALSVSSNEAEDGRGDGSTRPDWEVLDDHHVRLRAERSGSGTGRIYTITITCTDQSGNSATEEVTVLVPHDRGQHLGTQGGNGAGNGNGNGGPVHGHHGGGSRH
jgi:hypothetical protein